MSDPTAFGLGWGAILVGVGVIILLGIFDSIKNWFMNRSK